MDHLELATRCEAKTLPFVIRPEEHLSEVRNLPEDPEYVPLTGSYLDGRDRQVVIVVPSLAYMIEDPTPDGLLGELFRIGDIPPPIVGRDEGLPPQEVPLVVISLEGERPGRGEGEVPMQEGLAP